MGTERLLTRHPGKRAAACLFAGAAMLASALAAAQDGSRPR